MSKIVPRLHSEQKIITRSLKTGNAGFTPLQTKNNTIEDRLKRLSNGKGKFITGFTLMELMVAMGVFAIVITIASSILLHSLKTTRFVANQAGAIDNISLAMEQMVREIRTGSGLVWSEGISQSFTFVNYDGEVTTYGFCDMRMCRNGQPITAANTMIEGSFYITDFGGSKTPRITVAANAEDERGNPLGSVQTSVSARLIYYKDY